MHVTAYTPPYSHAPFCGRREREPAPHNHSKSVRLYAWGIENGVFVAVCIRLQGRYILPGLRRPLLERNRERGSHSSTGPVESANVSRALLLIIC